MTDADHRAAAPAVAAATSMRLLAAIGALCCAVAVGTGAYAMHATLASQDHERLAIAALFGFAHGLALAAIAPRTSSRARRAGLWIVLLGTLLFAGSLAGTALLGTRPVLAPIGGSALILGWLLVALGFVVE